MVALTFTADSNMTESTRSEQSVLLAKAITFMINIYCIYMHHFFQLYFQYNLFFFFLTFLINQTNSAYIMSITVVAFNASLFKIYPQTHCSNSSSVFSTISVHWNCTLRNWPLEGRQEICHS